MTYRTIAAAIALTLAPVLAHAACSERGHQAQSCAPGTVWDAGQQTCVQQLNG
jgi:hypothetical protein